MQSGKGNIVNRGVKNHIRDRNHTFNANEESKVNSTLNYKE